MHCPVVALAWYCAGAAILSGLWPGATFIALDLMYVLHYHNI